MAIEPFMRELADSTEYQSLFKPPKTFGLHSGRVYLKPGTDCGEHTTGINEEMLVFLSGQGQAVIGEDRIFEVGKGKILYIPPQTVHNIINNSNEPLIYIFCVAPARCDAVPSRRGLLRPPVSTRRRAEAGRNEASVKPRLDAPRQAGGVGEKQK